MRRKNKLVLWPAYFDFDNSSRLGRRIPKKMALRGVKSEEIFKAANDLGLNPILNPGTVYSKHPWLRTGAVLVDKVGPKTGILKDLSLKIRVNRASK